MKKSIELRQEKQGLVDQLETLTQKDTLSKEEEARADQLIDDISALNSSIERAEKTEALLQEKATQVAKQRANNDQRRNVEKDSPETKAAKNFSLLRAINLTSRGKELDGLEREMHEEAQREMREAGVTPEGNLHVPSMVFSRDMTAGTDTAGGHSVQTDLGQLIPILEPKLQTESLGASVLRGLRGDLKFPRNDADASATWEGENDANAETSPTLDQITLSPNRVGAFTDISKQLIVQSSMDVENFIRQRLNFAVRKAVDSAAINGAGSGSVPEGILNVTGIGDVVGGTDGAVPTWPNIVSLETEIAVDNADMGNLAYLTTPGVRGLLKSTVLDAGSGQFIWGQGSTELNGYRAEVSTQVPSTLTKGTSNDCHAIIFGNWAELLIGQWAGIDLVVDPYTSSKNALVTLVINSWWDVAVRHAESFAAMKDAKLS